MLDFKLNTLNADDKKGIIRVCFACYDKEDLYYSYKLSETVYKNNYKILLISNKNLADSIIKDIQTNNIWDKVIIIDEKDIENNENTSRKIKIQLDSIKFYNIDILHYFNIYNDSYLCYMFNYILYNTKIIKSNYGKYNENNLEDICNIDKNRIAEVWAYSDNIDNLNIIPLDR